MNISKGMKNSKRKTEVTEIQTASFASVSQVETRAKIREAAS